ncbi:MAG TPA: acyltransferase [Novosphingobium sp.]|nr:acyltransferase [Novosphingobium sp.]
MNRLHGLDGLRGVAALMVFAHHLRGFGLPMPITTFYLGVDIFFALSGFVMARTYEDRLRSGIGTARFTIMRYRRLWLPATIGSAIGFAICVWKFGLSAELVAALAAILLFLPAPWLSRGAYAINIPIWTLFIELFCNVVHAAILARASTRTLLALLGLCGVGFAMLVLCHLDMLKGITATSTLLAIPRGLASYLIGILIFRIWREAPLGRTPMMAIFGFPAIIAGLGVLPQAVAMLLAVFVVSPLILRASLGLGEVRWLSWLGTYSFPLYAVHMPILSLAAVPGVPVAGAVMLSLGTALLVTVLIGNDRFARPQRRVPAPA